MAARLKPSSKIDQSYHYLRRELNNTKFSPPSIFNQLKMVFIYFSLIFIREKSASKKDIADKKKLLSTLKTLLSSKEVNLINYQSEVNKLKLMTLDFVNRRESERDNLRRKLREEKFNELYSEKNETADLKEQAEVYEQSRELVTIFHKTTSAKPAEHALMLKESYALLKMQPRTVDESDDDFQDRLLKHTSNPVFTASDTKHEGWFKCSDYAYAYLSNYASPVIDQAFMLNGVSHLENENVSPMKMSK